MSSSAWEQLKRNWVSFVMTALLGLSSFTAYKVDRFVDKVNNIEKETMINSITDSIQTTDIREIKIAQGQIQTNCGEFKLRLEKLEAILPNNKNKPE